LTILSNQNSEKLILFLRYFL